MIWKQISTLVSGLIRLIELRRLPEWVAGEVIVHVFVRGIHEGDHFVDCAPKLLRNVVRNLQSMRTKFSAHSFGLTQNDCAIGHLFILVNEVTD